MTNVPNRRLLRAASGGAGHGGPSPEKRPRRSVHCLLVALALASAGCADLFDDGPGGASGEGSGAGGPPAAAPGAPEGPGGPPGSGSPVTAPANPSATAPAPAPAPAPEALDPTGPVGGFGPALLDPARGFRIDLLIEPGAEPAGRTLPALSSALEAATGKAVITTGPATVRSSGPWTAGAIRQVGEQLGGGFGGGEAGFRLLFLTGEFADNASALGVAVNAGTAAIFTEKIAGAAGLLGDRSRFELAVATHEAGHLLGLVNLVVKSGREDPEHPGHSPNRGSVMFWAVESDLIGTLLQGGPPTTFDDGDRAELEAIRRSH